MWHAFDSEIALVSVHVPPSNRPQIWAAAGKTATVFKQRPWLSDLVLDALLEALKGRPAILAGDWNEAPNYPSEDDAGTAEWFDRARRNGLVEIVNPTSMDRYEPTSCATRSGPIRTITSL